MNVAFVAAILALVAGVFLNIDLLVLGTIAAFALALVAYAAGHVTLHRRVAASSDARVTRDDSVGAALRLIWLNLLLYGGFVVGALGLAVVVGVL